MDSFKPDEILRMDKGGNRKCRAFFAAAAGFRDGLSIAERYGSDFGEDYKEKVALCSALLCPALLIRR